MKETRYLEFKELVNQGFLKTVSAYANYKGGKIKFGIKDDGTIVGIKNAKKMSLDIEHKINDSIKPSVDFILNIDESTFVITLTIFEGKNKPYFYKSKAYKRNDTSTIEVDQLELKRLILLGSNQSYESLLTKNQDLKFISLEKYLKEKIKINKITEDILISLNLLEIKKGYNIAAELLSDSNSFVGIDIAKFGENENKILMRKTLENSSILLQFSDAINIFNENYQLEIIEGAIRQKVNLIPEEAFRESLANAIVHREWDVNAYIKISMFDESIEIISPGGLPEGLNEEEYLNGQISVLRNPIIGNIFYRLGFIEKFGTGIKRIINSYEKSLIKPKFEIFENSIKIVLPTIKNDIDETLNNDEKTVFMTFKPNKKYTSSEIVNLTNLGKTKVVSLLNDLVEKGYIRKTGTGRSTKYNL